MSKKDKPRVYVSGAGVLSVKSSELLKTKAAQHQLDALAKLKNRNPGNKKSLTN